MSASVIIPTFNRADLLARCLRSLVAAGVPDLEIIVVDDGGSDHSADVVAGFPGARYLRQQNAGPAAARNFGFTASRGQYVTFIDSDDEWINGGIQRLASQLDANEDVEIVFADTAMGNPETGFVSFVDTYGGDAFYRLPHQNRPALRILERQPFLMQLSTRNVMFLGSMLFRRQAFESLQGFNPRLCGAADWEVFMRAVVQTRVAYSEGPAVSRYHKHSEAMSLNDDHMEGDYINALNSVLDKCALQPIERTHISGRVRQHVFDWAYVAYDERRFDVARQRLRLSASLGQMGAREAIFLAATYFPPGFIAALRRTRRACGL